MDVVQTKVADRKKELQAAFVQEADLVAQVESIQKQLNLLSIQIGQMEQRAIGDEDPTDKTEEKATLLEQEMPKCLKEGV